MSPAINTSREAIVLIAEFRGGQTANQTINARISTAQRRDQLPKNQSHGANLASTRSIILRFLAVLTSWAGLIQSNEVRPALAWRLTVLRAFASRPRKAREHRSAPAPVVPRRRKRTAARNPKAG